MNFKTIMLCFGLLLMSAAATVSLPSARVVDSSVRSQHADMSTVLELLDQADPSDNDIFVETRPELEPALRPSVRPSPAQHIIETLSSPRYIEAPDFQEHGSLPPALDINRQLTLLAASKRVRPPVDIVHHPDEKLPAEKLERNAYLSSSPLFRDDFPSEDIDYIIEPLEVDPEPITDDKQKPRISTSVSVSTSVSYSNSSSSADTSSSTSSTPSTSSAAGSLVSTTPPPQVTSTAPSSTTATILIPEETKIVSLPLVADYEDAPTASNRKFPSYVSSDTFRFRTPSEYPVDDALSPLGHILAGFGGELGPFGGDVRRDAFITGFRPDGF